MQWLEKRPGESREFTFSFAELPEIVNGDTLASVTSVISTRKAGSGTLTIGTGAVSGTGAVVVQISGGTDGDKFHVAATAVTNLGSELVSVMPLLITNEPKGRPA